MFKFLEKMKNYCKLFFILIINLTWPFTTRSIHIKLDMKIDHQKIFLGKFVIKKLLIFIFFILIKKN